jgi:hypothetical protein
MPKHEELIEHITVFGTPPGAGIVDTVQIPPETLTAIKQQYPTYNGHPTAEQIDTMANDILDRAVKAEKEYGTALKFDTDKLPLNLLSTEAMNQTADVLKFGAQKYAAHNWRKGFAWSRPLAAAMRHITAFNDGEDRDPESGLSHLAHAACCIMFLLEFEKTHPELDDRYKP